MAKVRKQTNLHGMVASSDWMMSGVLVLGLVSFFLVARKQQVKLREVIYVPVGDVSSCGG